MTITINTNNNYTLLDGLSKAQPVQHSSSVYPIHILHFTLSYMSFVLFRVCSTSNNITINVTLLTTFSFQISSSQHKPAKRNDWTMKLDVEPETQPQVCSLVYTPFQDWRWQSMGSQQNEDETVYKFLWLPHLFSGQLSFHTSVCTHQYIVSFWNCCLFVGPVQHAVLIPPRLWHVKTGQMVHQHKQRRTSGMTPCWR